MWRGQKYTECYFYFCGKIGLISRWIIIRWKLKIICTLACFPPPDNWLFRALLGGLLEEGRFGGISQVKVNKTKSKVEMLLPYFWPSLQLWYIPSLTKQKQKRFVNQKCSRMSTERYWLSLPYCHTQVRLAPISMEPFACFSWHVFFIDASLMIWLVLTLPWTMWTPNIESAISLCSHKLQ